MRNRTVTLSLAALAVVAVAVAVVAWALASDGQQAESVRAPRAAGATSAAASSRGADGPVRRVDVSLGDFYVRPSTVTVPRGTRLVLRVTNRSGMDHDLQLEGGKTGTGMLSPGQTRTVDYGVIEASRQAWCTVPGHKAMGMVMKIVVAGGAAGKAESATGASRGSDGTGMGGMAGGVDMAGDMTAGAGKAAATAAGGSADARVDFAARPAAGWHAVDPQLAPAPGGRVHHIRLVAEDKLIEVAPGVTQRMWTFGGQVPAPTLHGHVGDVFDVTLVNHTDMDHSIDFHAASEPMEAMREVPPGGSTTYQFKAAYSGIFLYHCGTAPVIEHLANGMFGAVVIDPPALPRVGRQFLVIQSELYLGPQGHAGDYAKMLRVDPDAVVFNGYVNQYLSSPLRVRAGQSVRIWVLDAGPSEDTSFHVVGAPFTTAYKEGAYLLRPGPLHGASQALDLSPGQGGFVQFTPTRPGHYELLDHHLDHAAMGAAGYLRVER